MKLEIKKTTQIYSYLSTGIYNKYTPSNMNCKEHKIELNTYRNKKWISVNSLFLVIEEYRDYSNGNLEGFRDLLIKELEEKQ